MSQDRKLQFSAKEKYLEKAKELGKKDTERLMSRMRGRFFRKFDEEKITDLEDVALQLEYEDEQLEAWRKTVAEIRKREKK